MGQIVFNTKYTQKQLGLKISGRRETPWGYIDNDQHLLNGRVVIFVDGSTSKP